MESLLRVFPLLQQEVCLEQGDLRLGIRNLIFHDHLHCFLQRKLCHIQKLALVQILCGGAGELFCQIHMDDLCIICGVGKSFPK